MASILFIACIMLYLVEPICHAMKHFRALCMHVTAKIEALFDFRDTSLWSEFVDQTLDPFINQFVFELHTGQNVTNKLDQDKGYKQIVMELAAVYHARLDFLNSNLNKFNLVFPVSFVFIIVGTLVYLKNYLKRDDFKNNLIGMRFLELDEKRCRKGMSDVYE